MRIKLIYGSDTGNTEIVTEDIKKLLNNIEVTTVSDLTSEDWDHDRFILGIPTWYDGELQSDWEDYFEEFKTIDFTDKTVAIFGLGDQIGYEEWFCDGIGILAEVILKNGGKVIGYTDKDESYDFDTTPKSIIKGDIFYGLCLDEDNQDELTQERLGKWVEQLKLEF
jgi:flavodoxin I|tara:strand:- start:2868 stop:3368 length:501 start_codon:yes stop_codon:yes gene_type:complete